ncbi:MAG: SDR family oxidoreductase [Candidatus Nephthysia bennettiae]|uniref:SDR family NAD(P)-dependent oxidoreductase n=1 Tax=Candidatus Nephthysia bennettiae TaxID=3127016 RepID=A0A934N5K4_9BACT|nr:SDR family NAD(P)-dependent oxidoreductase [Candidatus Dormibacteraeota bacterium]MBJ7612891.1 SDR family NAD(P)-dependent oxidoreductase [Candidatus Dormibacteraeota bacterium]PZR99426.1 MAG: SDR family oxidoreductase [Candidatus Dormibacteraeota bacterium]
MTPARRIAVVTGASSGIGAATVRALAREGFQPVLAARRMDRLEELAAEADGVALELDVTDPGSVERFAATVDERFGMCHVLVNNAGLALGLSPIAETPDSDWIGMLDVNVVGLLRTTRALLPLLRKAPSGHIVNLGSIAGFEVYRGGAGYAATKHAVRAISRTLRIELNGEPIRVTEIDPGMVETEFSLVRFRGDESAAANVYKGLKPLSGDDVADCIAFAVNRPPHVDIDEIVIRPLAQANSFTVHRESG